MTVIVKIEIETDETTKPIGNIRITNTTGPIEGETDFADYAVAYSYSDGVDTHFLSRIIRGFPRREGNVLALLLAALAQLEGDQLVRGEGEFRDGGMNFMHKMIERAWFRK